MAFSFACRRWSSGPSEERVQLLRVRAEAGGAAWSARSHVLLVSGLVLEGTSSAVAGASRVGGRGRTSACQGRAVLAVRRSFEGLGRVWRRG